MANFNRGAGITEERVSGGTLKKQEIGGGKRFETFTPDKPITPGEPEAPTRPTIPTGAGAKDIIGISATGEAIRRPEAKKTTRYTEPFFEQQKETESDIRRRMLEGAEEQVRAVEKRQFREREEEKVRGTGRAGETRAVGARAGVLGQDFGIAQKRATEQFNVQQAELLQAKQSQEIANIYNKFDERADERIKLERELAFKSREEQVAKQEELLGEARGAFSLLAQNNPMEWDLMDDEDRQEWITQTGYTPEIAEVVFNASKPQDSAIEWDKRVVGNTLIYSGIDPLTGKLKTMQHDLPTGADDLQIIDGVPYNRIKQEDGTFKLEKAVGFEEPEPTRKEELDIEAKELDIKKKLKDLEETKELDSKTITQVDKISSSFDSAPIVKNFNEVQNKKIGFDSIISRGTGPSDLASVFDFMKTLDPTSVVRESEYAEASKSGNVFLGAMSKFNALFKKEGQKLPQSVRDEFKAIVDEKFNAIQRQYSNLRSEKARLIEQKTGKSGGEEYLIDYDFTISQKPTGEVETGGDFDAIWD